MIFKKDLHLFFIFWNMNFGKYVIYTFLRIKNLDAILFVYIEICIYLYMYINIHTYSFMFSSFFYVLAFMFYLCLSLFPA